MYAALYKLLALLNLDWPYLLVSEYKVYVKTKVCDLCTIYVCHCVVNISGYTPSFCVLGPIHRNVIYNSGYCMVFYIGMCSYGKGLSAS